MTWYRTGTVDVSNGGTTVIGNGTAWIATVRPGDALQLDGEAQHYEIASVNSDTALTLVNGYLGSSKSGQAYAIVPYQGFFAAARGALTDAIAVLQSHASRALAGKFTDGTAAAPGVAFETDPDTGFWRKAANQLAASTGGVQRLLLSSTALQVDVPITGTAVQSGPADTTAGRLLKFGTAVLGGTALDNAAAANDLNNHTTFGLCDINAATLNSPLAAQSGLCLALPRNSGRVLQIAAEVRGQTDVRVLWVRVLGASGWGVWRPLTPEYGSNSNGFYLRLTDGTQICWGQFTYSAVSCSTAYAGGFRSAAGAAITFPIGGFTGTEPRVAILSSDVAASDALVAGIVPGFSSFSARLWRATSGTANFTGNYIAVGKYY